MYISQYCKKVPDICWWHDSSLKTKEGKTVEYYLNENGIIVPYYWNHDYKGTVKK